MTRTGALVSGCRVGVTVFGQFEKIYRRCQLPPSRYADALKMKSRDRKEKVSVSGSAVAVQGGVTVGELHTYALALPRAADHQRSEEHTSELQSLMRTSYAVLRLTKKK